MSLDDNSLPQDDSRKDWLWRHVILSTYGSWLPGDKRGFRTRRHREHVEGDYKSPPPPGEHGRLEDVVRSTMKHPPTRLPPLVRRAVGVALIDRLEMLDVLVVCIAVSGERVHLLAKMPASPTVVWKWIGTAKRHAWFVLRDEGWDGKMWGGKGKAIPVRNRQYQMRVYRYIIDHERQGAWVWKWGDPRPGERR